jgi:hypothetical protein
MYHDSTYEDKKQHLTFAIQYKYRKLNAVVRELNEAVVLLNDFIHYRNNKFKPTFSDEETSRMIENQRLN